MLSQTAQEYKNATEILPIQTRIGSPQNRRHRELPVPALIWTKDYEKNPAKFLRMIQELADALLLGGPTLYHKNINQGLLVEAVAGKLHDKDYYNYERAFGNNSNMQIQDNSFFYTAKETLSGQITSLPFEFSVKNVSSEYGEKLMTKMAKKTSKIAGNLFAEYAQQNGVDLSFLEDKTVNMGGSKEEIFERMREGEKLEYILHKLIMDVHYNYDIEALCEEAFSSKFDVNAEFAIIDVVNGIVEPKILQPSQVCWIAGKNVRNFKDRSVQSVCAVDYITFTEAMEKYGFELNTGTGAQGIKDAIKSLQYGQMLSPYNPHRPYFTEYYHSSDATSSYSQDLNKATLPLWNGVDYMGYFYPWQGTTQGLSMTMMEQKLYWKMLVPRRYAIEINGKPATESTFEKWQKDNYNRDLIARFEEIDPEEKPKKGVFWKEKPKVELWEATRLGHGTLINVGRYKYAANKTGRGPNIGFPIVAEISYERSFAYIGLQQAIWCNVMFRHISEIMSQVGLSTAIMMDMDTGIDPLSFLFNAKKTGIAMYNGSKLNGTQNSAIKHLDIMKLGNHIEEIGAMFTMVGAMTMDYENKVGASKQVQGAPTSDYQGKAVTQMNVVNQSQLARKKFGEHSRFKTQMLQSLADVLVEVFSKDEWTTIRTSQGEREYLKLTSELRNIEPNVLLYFGFDLKEKNDRIINMVETTLASGGAEMFDTMLEVMEKTSPTEAIAIFRKNKERLLEIQAAQQQAAQQQAQAENQLKQQQIASPVEVAKVNQQTAFGVADRKAEDRQRGDEEKGNLTDIKHYQDLERAAQQADAAYDMETHRAALQQSDENQE